MVKEISLSGVQSLRLALLFLLCLGRPQLPSSEARPLLPTVSEESDTVAVRACVYIMRFKNMGYLMAPLNRWWTWLVGFYVVLERVLPILISRQSGHIIDGFSSQVGPGKLALSFQDAGADAIQWH